MCETITNCCAKSKNPLEYFQDIDIQYPDVLSKTSRSIAFQVFWEGLLDEGKQWNILDRISSHRNDYQMTSCPPCPVLSHTAGNRTLSTEDLEESKRWLQKIRGKLVEVDVYQHLREQLKDERGTVFFGYNTNTYLGLFTEDDSTGAFVSLEMSEYWKNLAFLKGLNTDEIINSKDCKILVEFVKTKLAKSNTLSDFVAEAVSEGGRKTKIKHLEKVVTKVSRFVEDHMKDHSWKSFDGVVADITEELLACAYTKAHIESSGSEKDIFFVFPKRKILMQIEVKDSKPEKISNSVRDAKKQIEDMKSWLQKAHGDLFDGWKYISVIALTQCERKQITKQSIGKGTNAVFITKEDMDDCLLQWWKEIDEKHGEIQDVAECAKQEQKYVEFMKRTVGFISFTNDIRSSLSKHYEKICEDLTGSKFLSAGASDNDLVAQEEHSLSSNLNKVEETKRRYVRAIFWSPQQKQLVENRALKLLFHSDFGTGKTLIFKATAKEIAKDENQTVIFITMPRLFYYEGVVKAHHLKPTIFELATAQEFRGTNITFISDTLWMKEGEDIKAAQLRFMEFATKNLNSHIFVDEYRSLNQEHIEKHMKFMKSICDHHTGHFWLAVRLSPLDSSTAAKLPTEHYKELNIELGILLINLRCTGKIMETGNKARTQFDQYRLRPPNKAAAPLETSIGSKPEILKSTTKEEIADNVRVAIKQFKHEPFVIIVDHPDKRVTEPYTSFPDTIASALGDLKCTRYLLNEVNDETEINSFLKDPEGVLLTDVEMFTGMECKNIVYVCGKEMDVDALLRSVSILKCIQYVEE